MSVKGFGKILNSQYFTAAPDAGSQLEMHVVTQLEGLIDHLHLTKHFFAAFRALYGFFAVELFELGYDLFLVFDLGLIVEPGALLLFPQGFLFFGIDSVIAGKESGGCIFDLDDFSDSTVKKVSVVRYDDNGAAIVG